MPNRDFASGISLGKIAFAAGVTRMSASRALRNQPGVSAETRGKIVRIARQLGYRPDPHISEWMLRVRQSKKRDLLPLAWLNTSRICDDWHASPHLVPYFEGAAARAEEFGYRLEEIWTREPAMTSRRVSEILYRRGIQGLLVTPPSHVELGRLLLDWKYFAVVSVEMAVHAPAIHRVTQDYYYNITLAIKMLKRLGYHRLGFILPEAVDRRSSHICRAAISYYHSHIPIKDRIPIISDTHVVEHDLSKWLACHQPDVILGQHSRLVEWIESAALRVPHDIGVVHLALEGDCSDWAGIWARKREIGAAAVDSLVSLVQNQSFGLPETPCDSLIRGRWQLGKTLLAPNRRGSQC